MEEDKIKINWFTKLLLKFWPRMAMRLFADKLDANYWTLEHAHETFSGVGRIDFIPYSSGYRGFMMVLDRKIALYFNQDEDRFVYDGYEMGDYDKGDVTIFDNSKH